MTMPSVAVLGSEPHAITLTSEIRELPPENGWLMTEPTGRVSAACTCGQHTGGYIDRSQFDANAWREHAGI